MYNYIKEFESNKYTLDEVREIAKIIKLPHNKESVEQFLRENQKKYKYSFVETLGIDNREYYSKIESKHVEGYIFL